MSSWSTCAAYSGNPDKEGMMAARLALRDKAIAALKDFTNAKDSSYSRISELKVHCENLRYACAKYLIFTTWMRNGVGGSLIHSIYPNTKEQADAAIENLEWQREEDLREGTWEWLHTGFEYKYYTAVLNKPEWWDKVCCNI